MDAGKLRHRIEIQSPVKTKLASGQQSITWVPFHRCWAQAQCKDSSTVDSNGAVAHESLHRFYIRWKSGITAEMRVVWDGRVFELVGPPVDWAAERQGLTLITRELVRNGQA